jgi:hypothetical protein
VGRFLEKRPLVVSVKLLVIGSDERHIASPLVRHHAGTHRAMYHVKYSFIEEAFRGKARWVERHRQKMTMGTAVWFASVVLKVLEQDRPEGVFAGSDDGPRQTSSEDAVSSPVKSASFLVGAQVIISSCGQRSAAHENNRWYRRETSVPAET